MGPVARTSLRNACYIVAGNAEERGNLRSY